MTPVSMIDWTDCDAVERNSAKVSAAWLFKGARVPVDGLFQNNEGGASVEEFLAWFPGVGRDQVNSVLTHARQG